MDSWLGCRSWHRRELRLGPDDWHAVVEDDWRGALVLLRHGRVELFGLHGDRALMEEGAVLCFDRVAVRAVHNPGDVPALLVGITRARRP